MPLFRALAKNMAPMTNADESPTNRLTLLTLFPIYLSLSLSYTITGGAARHDKVKPKTWRISASADATWYLRLQVFTTDQPRCYAFDKVLRPPGFYKKKLWLSCFQNKIFMKNSFFSLVDGGT